MVHLIPGDVLDFNTLLASSDNGSRRITLQESSKLNEELFGDLGEQVDLNSRKINVDYDSSSTERKTKHTMSQNNTEKSATRRDIVKLGSNSTATEIATHSRSNSQMAGNNSYNSSPESNFPYTPIDSSDSCTTNSNTDMDFKLFKDEMFGSDLSDEFSNDISTSNNPLLFNDNFLDKEIDKMMSAPLVGFPSDGDIASHEHSIENFIFDASAPTIHSSTQSKRKHSEEINELDESLKKRKVARDTVARDQETKTQTNNESVLTSKENKFLKCFSILRTNYLSLCEAYNTALDKLEVAEMEKNALLFKCSESEHEKDQWKIDKDRLLLEREDMKVLLDGLLHEVTVLRRNSKMNETRKV